MTVACEEDSLDVHKLVLSANSTFFRKILSQQKQAHSYIYIRGLKFQDLTSIINFIYLGETKVAGEELPRFLEAAQELGIRGLGPDHIKGCVPKNTSFSTLSNRSIKSESSSGSLKRSISSKQTLEVVKEDDEKKAEEANLYEIVGEENVMNCSFGSELSKISQRMSHMKQAKLDNIKRIKSSLNENYNPNDTLDSVLPHAEEYVEDTFDEEMIEDEAEVSTDSAMVIDGSAASDQNAQLDLEISLRMLKIRLVNIYFP